MAQLWGGRFTKETDKKVYDFNASINFDKRLIERDCEGSVAHATMLSKCGILTKEEATDIIDGLMKKKWKMLQNSLRMMFLMVN